MQEAQSVGATGYSLAKWSPAVTARGTGVRVPVREVPIGRADKPYTIAHRIGG